MDTHRAGQNVFVCWWCYVTTTQADSLGAARIQRELEQQLKRKTIQLRLALLAVALLIGGFCGFFLTSCPSSF